MHAVVEKIRIPYPRGAGGYIAVNRHWERYEHAVEVLPPRVYALAARPLSVITAGDLEALEEHLADEPDPDRHRLLELLAACLRIRFRAGTDVPLAVTFPPPEPTTE